MPIYEWQCGRGHRFEVIVSIAANKAMQRCPMCGGRSERVISAFAIHCGASIATATERAAAREIDVTQLKVPPFARPCGMDDFSAARLAAHKHGRGAEFDDRTAVRAEREKKGGAKEIARHGRHGGPPY